MLLQRQNTGPWDMKSVIEQLVGAIAQPFPTDMEGPLLAKWGTRQGVCVRLLQMVLQLYGERAEKDMREGKLCCSTATCLDVCSRSATHGLNLCCFALRGCKYEWIQSGAMRGIHGLASNCGQPLTFCQLCHLRV